jgi:NADH:ubiquinone oxidoreductase subunit 4 (subunit M)
MYQARHSRRLLLTKGILGWRATLPLLWFLVLMSNIAAPPTYNLMAELLLIVNLSLVSPLNAFFLVLVILVGTRYTLIMYRSSIQGRVISFNAMTPLSPLASLRIFNHLFWSFFIILAVEAVII